MKGGGCFVDVWKCGFSVGNGKVTATSITAVCAAAAVVSAVVPP